MWGQRDLFRPMDRHRQPVDRDGAARWEAAASAKWKDCRPCCLCSARDAQKTKETLAICCCIYDLSDWQEKKDFEKKSYMYHTPRNFSPKHSRPKTGLSTWDGEHLYGPPQGLPRPIWPNELNLSCRTVSEAHQIQKRHDTDPVYP